MIKLRNLKEFKVLEGIRKRGVKVVSERQKELSSEMVQLMTELNISEDLAEAIIKI